MSISAYSFIATRPNAQKAVAISSPPRVTSQTRGLIFAARASPRIAVTLIIRLLNAAMGSSLPLLSMSTISLGANS